MIETLLEEAKGEWYINKLPSRDLEPIKVHIYFNFIAYDIVNIFKRALTEKCRNAGIEVLRRDILRRVIHTRFFEPSSPMQARLTNPTVLLPTQIT